MNDISHGGDILSEKSFDGIFIYLDNDVDKGINKFLIFMHWVSFILKHNDAGSITLQRRACSNAKGFRCP